MHKISYHKFFLFIILITIAIGVGYMGWSTWKEYMGRRQGQNTSVTTPPPAPQPTQVPSTTPQLPVEPQTSVDTRSWGERFRDKTIPEVEGVTWQTYTNTEYGFEMEYPKEWGVNIKNNNPYAVDSFTFYSGNHGPYPPVLSLDIFHGTLREFARQISDLDQRFKNRGMVPDATINGIDVFIRGQNEGSNQDTLSVSFEKHGYTYSFGESFEWHSENNNKIIEHMIKTFHFLK